MLVIFPPSVFTRVTSPVDEVIANIPIHAKGDFAIGTRKLHQLTGNRRFKEMVRHQQQKRIAQVLPRLEHRQAVCFFPIPVNDGGDTNPRAVAQTLQERANTLPVVSGDHIKVICSGLPCGANDAFDQRDPQNGDEGFAVTAEP